MLEAENGQLNSKLKANQHELEEAKTALRSLRKETVQQESIAKKRMESLASQHLKYATTRNTFRDFEGFYNAGYNDYPHLKSEALLC